jgi:hypothetical protein
MSVSFESQSHENASKSVDLSSEMRKLRKSLRGEINRLKQGTMLDILGLLRGRAEAQKYSLANIVDLRDRVCYEVAQKENFEKVSFQSLQRILAANHKR